MRVEVGVSSGKTIGDGNAAVGGTEEISVESVRGLCSDDSKSILSPSPMPVLIIILSDREIGNRTALELRP